MAALPAKWKQVCRQVEAGAYEGWMRIVHTPQVQLGEVFSGRGMAVDGLPPPGSCTLMLFFDDYPGSRMRGRPVRRSEFVALMPKDELEAVMRSSFHLLSISVNEAMLRGYVDAVCGRPLGELIRASRCGLNMEPAAFANHVRDIQKMALSRPEILTDPVQARFFEESLLAAYARSLELPAERIPRHRRLELARRARAYLHDHAHEPLTLSELCRALCAPERTLHLSFREAFGMPPKAYLKTLRLNGARRSLLHRKPGDAVSGIASRWGFLHFGRFSVDYHRLFGERPSETLSRAPATRTR
jgi:AraC family ethanolamine operon transcriptional activator